MSKGLDALRRMAEHIRQADYDKENLEDYNVLQFVDDYQAIEKALKALEIIKREPLGFASLSIFVFKDYEEWEKVNPNSFTKEEFDLLKEVLL